VSLFLGFHFQEREPRVEKEAEFLHAYFEQFGGKKVAAFVEYDENGEAQDELRGSNEKYFHIGRMSV